MSNPDSSSPVAQALPPPLGERGALGWVHKNLFSNWRNSLLSVIAFTAVAAGGYYGLRWVFFQADWGVVGALGGRIAIGNYNTVDSCASQNCFWRPQAVLLGFILLLGAAWGIAGRSMTKKIALVAATILSLLAFLPYSWEDMGWDVRLLFGFNLPVLGLGWLLARFTPLNTYRRISFLAVVWFAISMMLLRGVSGAPGLHPVSIQDWGGFMVNLILAVGGIALSLPIGILLALARRSETPTIKVRVSLGSWRRELNLRLPIVKWLSVAFIEIFRGVPLLALLFLSQYLLPLAVPENFFLTNIPLLRTAIVITLFSAAYMAENVRGGLQGLHPGQAEAARALGLSGIKTIRLITLPQALRNVIPAIVGQFISLFKDTTLVYIIGVLEVVEIGRSFIQGNIQIWGRADMEYFIFVAMLFWIFTYGMSRISRKVEERLGVTIPAKA